MTVRSFRLKSLAAAGLCIAMVASAYPAFAQAPTRETQPAKAPATPDISAQPETPKRSPEVQKEIEKLVQEATAGIVRHGVKDAIAKPVGAIRIATYNIENLFDKESMTEGSRSPTPRKPDEHRQAAADAIKKLDADVIAFQEVESKAVLEKFRDDYLKDMGYTYISSVDAGDGRGIEQSVISRFPLSGEQVWLKRDTGQKHPEKLGKKSNPDAGKPIMLARSPLNVTVEIPATKDHPAAAIALWVVHHKSGPFYSYQREAEAAEVVKLVQEHAKAKPEQMVLVLGDFNAKTEEAALKAYLSNGFTEAFAGVSPTDPKYMTHVSGRSIDHILMNAPALAAQVKDTRFVLGTPQRREDQDWRKTSAPVGYASDHYPVVTDLVLKAR